MANLCSRGNMTCILTYLYIEPSSAVRNLGAFMDNLMNMDTFIKSKSRSTFYQIRKIGRIRKYLTMEACKTITQALIVSRLDYANSLLYGINAYHLKQLQRIQDSAARVIFRCAPREHAADLREKLHWLPVGYRINFRILTYVYKSVNELAPVYLTELLSKQANRRATRSYSAHSLQRAQTQNTYGDRAFENCGPYLWEKVPNYIKNAKSIQMFKKLLKTHFFKLAYNV